MLLETLSRLRGKHAPERSQENVNGSDSILSEDDPGNTSSHTIKAKGGSSIASSASSSRSPSKRYSNNLFGSGRLRDYTYLRTTSRISNSESTKTQSIAPSEAPSSLSRGNAASIADSLRPSTPPSTLSSVDPSLQSSPSPSNVSSVRGSSSTSLDQSQPVSASEQREQKQLNPTVLKRASMALETVIKEIEDEVDEEIVMPRTAPMPRHSDHQSTAFHQPQRQFSEASTRDTISSEIFEAGMAISSDKPIDAVEMQQRGPSPVPLNATPGYIPGMPRPMTPRDFDFFSDEHRSHSTTPRATSPNMISSFSMGEPATASVSISKILRRENSTSSNLARGSPRPTTPLFLQRPVASLGSMNGRHTPADDRNRSFDRGNGGVNGEHGAFDQEQPLSALLGRRRPASPLANSSFQPMSSVGYSISRPTTPSKISRPTTPSKHVWKSPVNDISPNLFGPASFASNTQRDRDNSWASDSGPSDSEVQQFIAATNAGGGTDVFGNIGPGVGLERKGTIGSPSSITPPSLQSASSLSSLEDNSRTWAPHRVNGNGRATSPLNESVSSQRSYGNVSASPLDNGTQQRNHRSITPTQTTQKPAANHTTNTSPRAARRSSRQGASISSSPFDFGPIPSLTLNPRVNSSSSSLESTGSSFHSWDDNNDKVLNIFDQIDAKPTWHDIPSETRNKADSDSEDEWEADEIVMGYAGLRKGDFAAIQERLVSVARTTEHRGSALRKRRPSTSQSNYSSRDLRVASPPPPSSPSANRSMAAEQQQKQTTAEYAPVVAPGLAHSLSVGSIDSSTGLRRNLTHVLFGDKEEETPETAISPPRPISPTVTPPTDDPLPSDTIAEASISELLQNALSHSHDAPPQVESPSSAPNYFLHRNPSVNRLPQTPQDQAALTLEVQQKVEAATAALKKPSHERLATVPRKRIDTSQISQPTLVSASTSVDAVPLKTPSINAGPSSGTSKIGSRFKKLRGSIRGKPMGDNATVASDKNSLSAGQTARYDAEKLKANSGPYSSGLVESNRQASAIASPPASAGPGLKGFMARFRGKRAPDAPQSSSSSTQESPQILSAPLTAVPKHWPTSPSPTTSTLSPNPSHAQIESEHRSHSRMEAGSLPVSPLAQQHLLIPDPGVGNGALETDALQQLFAAANKIGIDQSALNDLLVRSGSLSSKNMLARSASNSNSGSSHQKSNPNASSGDMYLAAPPLQQANLSLSSGSDNTATPIAMAFSSSQASSSNYGDDGTEPEDFGRRNSVKPDETLRRRNGAEANAVVRRTIIFVDPRQSVFDPAALKRATSKRRRASVQSTSNSNRSIHDRVPTPPPSKIPASKRFSHEPSPPVPHLPSTFGGQGDGPSNASADASRPGVDSMYEYYGDGRAPSDPNNHDNRGGEQTGVELIELANGDTIWKIVNGLRDDDDESIYSLGRNSIASEYSTHESGENMQVFVKEHVRTGSKGSQASMASRKKVSGGKPRPETKVMYSTPEHVAHLIEQISQGMDAGSFNFRPYHDSGSGSSPGARSSEPGHSASSSLSANEITWTMKEIDHMLTAMSPRSP
ncbi:hypothetical protein BKA70DRAFT_38169 [Coprinopsis sp. MPI-PUGE-AT-0042]|nr:hypothetical protein BKA70DRAFT_38169 [Coprinopsis sp. MPI-PUGE-AT-0042]